MGPDFIGNSGGIWSTDDNIYPGTIQLGGTVTAGNVVTATITVGATSYPFSITAGASDTLQSLVTAFVAAINASIPMQGFGITGGQGNLLVPAFSFMPKRNGTPLPSIAVAVSSGATVTATITRQPQDVLDAGPIWYLNRTTSQVPKPSDNIGTLLFGGGSSVNVNPTVAYAMLQGEVANPNLGNGLQGRFHITTAEDNPTTGNMGNRLTIERGLILYDNANQQAASGDRGSGTINVPASGGYFRDGVPLGIAFKATMGGTNQTGIVDGQITKLNFTTLGPNVGIPYDTINARWTPRAGMVRFSASALWGNPSAGKIYLFIAKNNTLFAGHEASSHAAVDTLDYASGTDYYDCRTLIIAGGGPHTVNGQTLYTWFEGYQL